MQHLSFPETVKEPPVNNATVAPSPEDTPYAEGAPYPEGAPEATSTSVKHDFAKMNGVVTTSENFQQSSQSDSTASIPEPEEVITVKQAWQQPWPKATIVGGGMLVLLGTLGSMVHGAQDAINTPAPKRIENTVATPTPNSDQEESPGSLKTKNALTSQEYELRMLNKQQPRAIPMTKSRVISQIPPQRYVVERITPPQTAPTKTTPLAPASNVVTPVSVSLTAQQPSQQPIKAAPPTPTAPIDPMQQWEMAANMGSYSSSGTSADAPVEKNTSTNNTSSTAHSIDHNSQADQEQTLNTPPENTNQPNVLLGTRVSGKLETPIAWSGASIAPTQNFLIKLSEPIKGIDQSIVVPTGAYIVATVSKVSSAGLLEMRATSVVVNSQSQQIPPEAILILAHNGNLLKAQLKNGDHVGSVGTALLNGVSTATSLANQPSVQTNFGSLNSFSSTVRSRTNVVAGLAQGATSQLVQQAQARRERALQSQDALKVFEVPSGTSVQLFFNQSVFLESGARGWGLGAREK